MSFFKFALLIDPETAAKDLVWSGQIDRKKYFLTLRGVRDKFSSFFSSPSTTSTKARRSFARMYVFFFYLFRFLG